MPSERPDTRRRRPLGGRAGSVMLALIGCIVIIVVGSGRRAEGTTWLGVDNVDVLYLIVFALAALVGLVLLIIANPFTTEWKPPPKRNRTGSGVLMAAVLIVLLWRPSLLDGFIDDDDSVETEEAIDVPVEEETAEQREPVAQATDIVLMLTVAGGLAVTVWVMNRRTTEAQPEADDANETAVPTDLVEAIDQASRELIASSDPRSAVLSAYATLERTLANQGMTRRRPETAGEHLRRAVRGLDIDPEPLARLGGLYERARFSNLPVTEQDQIRAAADLAEVHRDLEAVGPR